MFDLPHNNVSSGLAAVHCWVKICVCVPLVADWLFLASLWLPDGARYEQQRPITLAHRQQFSPHFRGGKIHLHSRGLTLLARGSIGSSKNEWGNGAVPHRHYYCPSSYNMCCWLPLLLDTTRFWNTHGSGQREIARSNAHGDCCFEKRAGRST